MLVTYMRKEEGRKEGRQKKLFSLFCTCEKNSLFWKNSRCVISFKRTRYMKYVCGVVLRIYLYAFFRHIHNEQKKNFLVEQMLYNASDFEKIRTLNSNF